MANQAPTTVPDQLRQPLVQESRLWDRTWFEWFRAQWVVVKSAVTGSGTTGGLAKWTSDSSIGTGQLSGDGTTPADSTVLTLAATGVVAGTYGDSSHVSQVTVDTKGRVTTAANVAISSGVVPPGGANTDIQYNDAGAFGGDGNLTWKKAVQQQGLIGNGSDSTLLLDGTSTHPISISSLDSGFSVGSEFVAGVQVAKDAIQGYVFIDQSGGSRVAVLGASTGETPGSPTVYAQWQELDVFSDRSADVVGDDTAGAIPGKSIGATRNAAGTGAASTLHGQRKDGTNWYEWQDATGRLRYGPARPTENGSVSDTSGTVIGTGDGTVTHTAGALTLNELVVGNGGADLKTVAATDGQIPIGKSSDGSVTLATLTAGANITITNAAGAVTIASTASGSGGSTLIGLERLLGDGTTTTFNLPDLAEYVVDVSDAGSTVDPTLYTLSADQSQVVFGTAPTAGHVLTFEYVVAQLAA